MAFIYSQASLFSALEFCPELLYLFLFEYFWSSSPVSTTSFLLQHLSRVFRIP
jgi:hypothetical protein